MNHATEAPACVEIPCFLNADFAKRKEFVSIEN